MEDELCAILQQHGVRCRLVGRLTYEGLRELVFQLHDWDSFRPPVGMWIMKHEDYEIDVSEHEGWGFFDEFIRPRIEDRLFMADQNVIAALIENGSDPEKEHALEYVFRGPADGLKRVADDLLRRGYEPFDELDYNTEQIVLVKRMVPQLSAVVSESIANFRAAEQAGVEFDGWGAHIVQ